MKKKLIIDENENSKKVDILYDLRYSKFLMGKT